MPLSSRNSSSPGCIGHEAVTLKLATTMHMPGKSKSVRLPGSTGGANGGHLKTYSANAI